MHCVLRSLLLLAFTTSAVSAQSALVVDPSGPPGTFVTIQDAVDAATDGDLVLVRPGSYPGFSMVGKGVTVVADGPVTLQKSGIIILWVVDVSDVPPGSAATVAGFDVDATATAFAANSGIAIDNCAGPVFVRDVNVVANEYVSAISVDDSSAVSVVDSELDASNGLEALGYGGSDSGHALYSRTSSVYLHGSELRSGKGMEGDYLKPPAHGDTGVAGWRVVGGFGLGVSSTLSGGIGGDAGDYIGAGCGDGGPGGPGLEIGTEFQTGQPTFVRSSLTLVPGPGGSQPNFPPCVPGGPGVPFDVQSGTLMTDDFPRRALETEALVRVGETKTETFVGEPGDFVWHVFGVVPEPAPVFLPELTGASFVGSPYFLRFRGLVPAGGEKVLSVVVPDPGIPFYTLYEQAYFWDGARFYVSNPQVSVVVSSAL